MVFPRRFLSLERRTNGRRAESRHRRAGEQRDAAPQRAELGHADTSVLRPQSLPGASGRRRPVALNRSRAASRSAANGPGKKSWTSPSAQCSRPSSAPATAARFWRLGRPVCSGAPAPSATPNGPAYRSSWCWNVPARNADAIEVLFEGADVGTEPDHPAPMPFARSLPLAKALHPDTLLATRMNGEILEPSHGYPVRLFVPGWYGVASVKWLRRIEVLNKPFRGYFQSVKYTVQRQTERGVQSEIVGPMMPKSEIIRPREGEVLGPGTNRLFGVSWAGEDSVSRVEVSTDGGATWSDATLAGPQAPYSWTMWEHLWEAKSSGEYTILARATSSRGRVQPAEHDAYEWRLPHSPHAAVVRAHRRRPLCGRVFPAQTILYDINAYAEDNMLLRLDVELEFSGGEGI